jgi:hypothetical protein
VTGPVGIVGIDMGHSRTSIALREGLGRQARASLVGDGRRRLVPNATRPDGTWGSAAADAFFDQVGDIAAAADQVLGWRTDPWSPPFLHGLHERLAAYLGGVSPIRRHGYEVCICTGQAEVAGWAGRNAGDPGDGPPATARSAAQRCAAAGLTDITFVRPTDALLCRWIADWMADPETYGMLGPLPLTGAKVLVVACGETCTVAAAYAITLDEVRQPISPLPGTAGRIERGSGEWTHGLAREVMNRCREGTRASSALAVLDATLEFGGFLGTQSPDESIEWSGALTDAMFAPLRIRRRDRAAQEQVRLTTDGVAELVAKALPESGPAQPIVVGGIGAVWPYITDALQKLENSAALWRSSEPEHDLAVGATWWPQLRGLVADTGGLGPPVLAATAEAADAPGSVGVTVSGAPSSPRGETDSASPRRPEDIPPWDRDI